MKFTSEMLDQYFEKLHEKAREEAVGNEWAYVAGMLKAHLRWTLGSDTERKIIEEMILEELAENA
jgi:hypothetical protein